MCLYLCGRSSFQGCFSSISLLTTHHSITERPKVYSHVATKCKESDSTPHSSHMQTYKVHAMAMWPARPVEKDGQTAAFEQMGGRRGKWQCAQSRCQEWCWSVKLKKGKKLKGCSGHIALTQVKGSGGHADLTCWCTQTRLPEASFLGLSVKPYIHTADEQKEREKQRKRLFSLTACRSTRMVRHSSTTLTEHKMSQRQMQIPANSALHLKVVAFSAHCFLNIENFLWCWTLQAASFKRTCCTLPMSSSISSYYCPSLYLDLPYCLRWAPATSSVFPDSSYSPWFFFSPQNTPNQYIKPYCQKHTLTIQM